MVLYQKSQFPDLKVGHDGTFYIQSKDGKVDRRKEGGIVSIKGLLQQLITNGNYEIEDDYWSKNWQKLRDL
ncbi:MAG: hypothetical protein HYX24_06755 [Candidatus Aenigmarchaeota archaeon]|nr:hypothetical protein [Candidatus Aenigmarchaeota archaeon]